MCICVCARDRRKDRMRNVWDAVGHHRTGFSTVFRFRVYYRATYFAEKVHKANVSVEAICLEFRDCLWHKGMNKWSNTQSLLQCQPSLCLFFVCLFVLFFITKTHKRGGGEIRFTKYLKAGSLHPILDLMTQIDGRYLWHFHYKQILKFKADY